MGDEIEGGKGALDNGRKEESKAVDRAEAGHADEHEDVYLPVADGLPNVLHVEVVGQMAVVFLEAAFNFITLLGCQEGRTVRVGPFVSGSVSNSG